MFFSRFVTAALFASSALLTVATPVPTKKDLG